MRISFETLVRGVLFVVTLCVAVVLEKLRMGPPALEIIDIEPGRIRRKSGRSTSMLGGKWVLLPRVRGGEWDRETELWREAAREIYDSFETRYVRGRDWEETVYYNQALEGITSADALYASRFADEEAVQDHFERLDEMYAEIDAGDYKRTVDIAEVGGTDPVLARLRRTMYKFDEVTVDFGRYGEPLFVDGTHRLGLAKVSSISSIPVRVHVRHRKWDRRRSSIVQYCRDNPTPYRVEHPDLPPVEPLFDSESILRDLEAEFDDPPLVEYTNYVYPVFSAEYDGDHAYSVPVSDEIRYMNETFEKGGQYDFVQVSAVEELPREDGVLVATLLAASPTDGLERVAEHAEPKKVIILSERRGNIDYSPPSGYVLERTAQYVDATCEIYRRTDCST